MKNKKSGVTIEEIKPKAKPKAKPRKRLAVAGLAIATGLLVLVSLLYGLNAFFDKYRLSFQSPIILRLPISVELRTQGQEVKEAEPVKQEPKKQETEKPKTTKQAPLKIAKVTAYSCEGLKTTAEILMNCPSLKSGQPTTANGEAPIPNKTMACDPANMGKVFYIQGLGEVRCNDTGGRIKGAGRFDVYLSSVQEAREWGVRRLAYRLVE